MRSNTLLFVCHTAKYNNGDEMLRQLAETIYKNGGYAAEHPLTRNWWHGYDSHATVLIWWHSHATALLSPLGEKRVSGYVATDITVKVL